MSSPDFLVRGRILRIVGNDCLALHPLLRAQPPALGEHTAEILTGLLGYSKSEVEELAKSETI